MKKLLVTRNRQKSSEQGFSIAVSTGFGLVIMMIGLTIMGRALKDSSVSASQKTISRSDAAAQVGSTRLLSLIAKYPQLAGVKDCDGIRSSSNNSCPDDGTKTSWKNTGNISNLTIAPSDSTRLDPIRAGQWVNIDSTKPERGQFRLAKYTPSSSGPGNVEMEGRVGQIDTSNTATNEIQTGSAKADAEIYFTAAQEDQLTYSNPGETVEKIPFPGLWLSVGPDTIGQDFKADGLLEHTSSTALNTYRIGADGNFETTAKPAPKTKLTIASFLPPKPSSGLIALGAVTNDLSLPRTTAETRTIGNGRNRTTVTIPADTYTTETINGVSTRVYRYSIASLEGNGNNSVINVNTINTAGATATNPAQKVIFYLDGNIEPGGNGAIKNQCMNPGSTADATSSGCDLTNFMIYGYNDTGSGKICTHGKHEIQAFIIAPKYTVGGNASGGGKGSFQGAVWAYQWSTTGDSGPCKGNGGSNQVMVTQKGKWTNVANWGEPTKITTKPNTYTTITTATSAKIGLK
jgi:hypothetical protein